MRARAIMRRVSAQIRRRFVCVSQQASPSMLGCAGNEFGMPASQCACYLERAVPVARVGTMRTLTLILRTGVITQISKRCSLPP